MNRITPLWLSITLILSGCAAVLGIVIGRAVMELIFYTFGTGL